MTLLAFTLAVFFGSAQAPQEGAPPPVPPPGKSIDVGGWKPDGKVVRADTLVKGTPIPEIKTSGPHRIAEGSGHHVQIEDPALVVKVIQEVVRAPR